MGRDLKKHWGKYGLILVLAFVSLVLLLHVIANATDPLWYDEVWRAYNVSFFHIFDHASIGTPISLGVLVLTKFFSLFINNEITQRFLSIISIFVLSFMVYWYGQRLRSKTFGALLALTVPMSAYLLNYSVQIQPYVLDALVALVLVYCFELYVSKRLPYIWFALICGLGLVFSIAAIWLFIAFVLWQLAALLRHKTYTSKDDWWYIIRWSIPTALFSFVYYKKFLKPQSGPGLSLYWSSYTWKGKSIGQVINYIITNTKSLFQNEILPTHTNRLSPKLFYANYIWLIALGLFVYGTVKLIQQRKYILPFVALASFAITFVAAYFVAWTYGDNRINSFQFILISLVAIYGLYDLLVNLWQRRKNYWAATLLGILVVAGALIYSAPYTIYKDAGHYWHQSKLPANERVGRGLYLQSMRATVAKVKTQIGPDDAVVTLHPMTWKGFLYYYNYYDGLPPKNTNAPAVYIFDSYDKRLTDLSGLLANLAKQYKTVWVIKGNGYGPTALEKFQAFKHITYLNSGTTTYYKLTN